MNQGDDRQRQIKIGRPYNTAQGLEFKKQYRINKRRMEFQCQLLAQIHQQYFAEFPQHPQNKRVQINYITALFEKYDCIRVYQVLLNLNQFYYKNGSIFPEDQLDYTSMIDIAYMFKQLRLNFGKQLRSIQLVLTMVFFLYNEKLINLSFYQYIEARIEGIVQRMLVGPPTSKIMDKIEILIITLTLQIARKEGIKIKF